MKNEETPTVVPHVITKSLKANNYGVNNTMLNVSSSATVRNLPLNCQVDNCMDISNCTKRVE